jgi:ubiquinone/menaquinone biosynthesis C-methylase UbiE
MSDLVGAATRTAMQSLVGIGRYIPDAADTWTLTHQRTAMGVRPGVDYDVPPRAIWHNYAATPREYLVGGKSDVDAMLRILADNGYSCSSGDKILEWGCGSGRITRWLADLAVNGEYWGVDIRESQIRWCREHLGWPFQFATTTTVPHLPFEDNFFHLVVSDVFANLRELPFAWLLELRRVTAPGGTLYLVIQDRHSVDVVLRTHRGNATPSLQRAYQELERQLRDPWAMIVVNRGNGACEVVYDLDYVREAWGRLFDIIATEREAYSGIGTALVLQKPR